MTVHIFTFPRLLIRTYSAAFFTWQGGMQTDAVPYFIPSSMAILISCHLAVGERSV
jgi:hypothetical protein